MSKPTLAVWKFASCDGCQLSLLDCEDELLALAGAIEIAEFREASSATVAGPYDLSLVEGSVTTAHDAERILQIRRDSKRLVTIGACATAGGIQALRNAADVQEFAGYINDLRAMMTQPVQDGLMGDALVNAVMPGLKQKYGSWNFFDYFAKRNILDMAKELRGDKQIPKPAEQ